MRSMFCVAALVLAFSHGAHAQDVSPRYYYGPMNSRGDGFKDELEKDGYWEITAGINSFGGALAIDFAIYRAAEMARAGGHRYVEIHDASTRSNRLGAESATLFARPTDIPAHPTACRSGKPKRCYTADVALVFARLSGADGQHPGLAAPSYLDRYGRTVTESGFGTGAISSATR